MRGRTTALGEAVPCPARTPGHVQQQKLHLIGQDPPVAQDEVFPEAGYIGCIEQRHARLLRCAGTLAVIAGAAGRHQVHPLVASPCGDGHDVLAR